MFSLTTACLVAYDFEFKDFSHFRCQVLHGGRLLQQVHVGIEDAIVNDRISRVAGGEKDLQVRTPSPGFVSKSATVHVRHDQIGVKKTDLRMCGESFQAPQRRLASR